jgi:hypothetical protein
MLDEANELKLPPAFSGPGQLVLFTRYGDPRSAGWAQKWITQWNVEQLHPWFPQQHIRIHKHFWPFLQAAFLELEKLGLHNEIKTVSTCYEVGHLHESPVLSVHSWGAAIDLNAAENAKGTAGKWSDQFIKVMEHNGIYCGQCWTGNKQPMHFAMVNG